MGGCRGQDVHKHLYKAARVTWLSPGRSTTQTLAYGCMRDQVVSIGTKHHKALCILTGPMSDKVVSYTKHHRASGIPTGRRSRTVVSYTKHHTAPGLLTGHMSDKVVSYTKHHTAPGILTGRRSGKVICYTKIPHLPRVTAVARKRSRSFCQNCRWQVTSRHAACTIRMWL